MFRIQKLGECLTVLTLGRQGENKAHQIQFDLSDWVTRYGAGTAMLVHKRKGDAAPYIVPTTLTGDTLTWEISSIDTAFSGAGLAELRYSINDVVVKSATFQTLILQSMTGDITIPSAFQSWYDALIDYINSIGASPENVSQAVADYMAEHPIAAPVTSVNQQTGDVSITAESLGINKASFAEINSLFSATEEE